VNIYSGVLLAPDACRKKRENKKILQARNIFIIFVDV
jgi:hypothetical protein